jgi:hypothetical protein
VVLVEQLGFVTLVGVGVELVLQLVSQLVQELGPGHLGRAERASVGDAQEAELDRVDHRCHTPLDNDGPRAEELRQGLGGRAEVDGSPRAARVGDLRRPLAEIHVPRQRRRVVGKPRQVVEDLPVLQLGQRVRLVHRALPKPVGDATARAGQGEDDGERGDLDAHVHAP